MAGNKYRHNDEFSISDLKVRIFVIGYEGVGESNVIFLMDDDAVRYAMVIDSYLIKREKNSPAINKTIDLLKEYGVSRLDVLCWTHPHDDHSKGMVKLLRHYCDAETVVIYPAFIENNSSDIVKLPRVSKTTVDCFLAANRAHQASVNPIEVIRNQFNSVDEFTVVNPYIDEERRDVCIEVITPIASFLETYVNNKLCLDPNELSISLVLKIDGYGFFFGGDTTNKHINNARKKSMGCCRFVKIPHHGSSTAGDLLNYLPGTMDAACTTLFQRGKSDLPDLDVVGRYKQFCPVHATANKKSRSTNRYGIVTYIYDFSFNFPELQIELSGNGVEL